MTSGNFTFQNYDNSANQIGPGIAGQVLHRDGVAQESTMPSQEEKLVEETATNSETAGLRRTPTQEDDIGEKRRGEEIQRLAKKYSTQSHQSIYEKNPFKDAADSVLDPTSPNFKPRAFAKSLLNLQSRDPEKWKQRTAGLAFKDLNVFGFGSATDYQKSVVRLRILMSPRMVVDILQGNIFLEVVGLAKKLVGQGKPRKIDILQNLDGVVHSGEMLVVLGPPGRLGCPKITIFMR
jgi:ATP-binding cassette subfamily G (WHITE) protein 2 (PDR)